MAIKILFYISIAICIISPVVLVFLAIKTATHSPSQEHLTKNDLYCNEETHEKFINHRSEEQILQDSMVRSSVRMHYSLYLLEDEFQEYKKKVLSVKLPQKNES